MFYIAVKKISYYEKMVAHRSDPLIYGVAERGFNVFLFGITKKISILKIGKFEKFCGGKNFLFWSTLSFFPRGLYQCFILQFKKINDFIKDIFTLLSMWVFLRSRYSVLHSTAFVFIEKLNKKLKISHLTTFSSLTSKFSSFLYR